MSAMIGGITWEGGSPLADDDSLLAIETRFGITLPETYRQVVQQADGASMDPNCFAYFNGARKRTDEACANNLLRIEPTRDDDLTPVSVAAADDYVPGIYVFATDAGGHFIALDYRSPDVANNPPVVVLNRNDPPSNRIHLVAPTFDAFLGMLHPESED